MNRFAAGVIGVGSMGANHARVYAEMPDVDLVGVSDLDADRAADVADEYDTDVLEADALVEAADGVSVAVPTGAHAPMARRCIEAGTAALVEKPFVEDRETGMELAAAARDAGVVLQVGHIERFNPAVQTLFELLGDVNLVAVSAERLGPPLDRDVDDGVVMDLMIHDIDILLSLVDGRVRAISATGRDDGQYATSQFTFDNGTVGRLTASRLTQRKIRRLDVTTEEMLVQVDYLDQSIRIHRQSRPAFDSSHAGLRYRSERVTERPIVDSGEPLRRELSSFVESARAGTAPEVTALDGLRTVETAQAVAARVDSTAVPSDGERAPRMPASLDAVESSVEGDGVRGDAER
jgi:predicted dehydrogenase